MISAIKRNNFRNIFFNPIRPHAYLYQTGVLPSTTKYIYAPMENNNVSFDLVSNKNKKIIVFLLQTVILISFFMCVLYEQQPLRLYQNNGY